MIYNEFQNNLEEHKKLIKNSYEQEIRINSKSKELNEMEELMKKYDIRAKVSMKTNKELNILKIKKEFKEKENGYIITIYRLEEEIRNLMKLLERNKEYYNKFKTIGKEIEEQKKTNEEMKFAFNKEIHGKNMELAIQKDREEELCKSLEELERDIEGYKSKEEGKKKERYRYSKRW